MSEASASWRSRALRVVGNVMAVAGIGFVALTVRRHLHAMPTLHMSPFVALALGLGVVANGVALLLGAWTWRTLLIAAGTPLSWRSSFSIVGRANIAKYLPGNVFHLVGRASLAAVETEATVPVVLATMTIETLMIIAVAGALGAPAAVAQFDDFRALLPEGQWVLFGAGVFAAILVVVVAGVLLRRKTVDGAALAKAAIADTVTCVLLGSSVYALLAAAFPMVVMPWSLCVSGFSLAWVLGFVTPGAPGGVGVREAVFVLLMSAGATSSDPGEMQSAAIAAIVVVGRLQSVAADIVAFLVARALAPPTRHRREATIK